jgi:replicative DNA helicase
MPDDNTPLAPINPPAASPTSSSVLPVHTLPHNLEAEQALLGAIMLDNQLHGQLGVPLSPSHFYDPVHRAIFDQMGEMIIRGTIADGVTLQAKFAASGALNELGGARYLGSLIMAACDPIACGDYARLIFDLAIRRDLIGVGLDLRHAAETADDGGKGAASLIEEAENRLFKLAETGQSSSGFKTFSKSMAEFMETATMAFERDGRLVGVSTGLQALDSRLGGLHPSDLLIIAGRPSMGKTALATNIAFNAARRYRGEIGKDGKEVAVEGARVGFFSLEMSAGQLTGRLVADFAGIPSDLIRKGGINKAQYAKLMDAAVELNSIPLHIDETGGISIAALSARARRLKRTKGLDLLIIDYLQLVTASTKRNGDSRVQEVTEITQGLKALAKELHIPVIALSQLSRQVENRDNKRPQLADLRESGSIEQDADAVMFVYRHAYYHERAEPDMGTPEHQAWEQKMAEIYNVAEVIVAKQRHGPIGTERLQFEAEFTRFSNLDPTIASQYGDDE